MLDVTVRKIGWALDWLIRISSIISGVALLLMMLQISLDVFTRNLFGFSLFGTSLFVAYYYMILVGFLSLAMTEQEDSHIKVDVLYELFSAKSKKYLMVLIQVFCAAFCLYVAWQTFGEGFKKLATGTLIVEQDIPVPIWPPYFAIPIGFLLFGTVFLQKLLSQREHPSKNES